MSKNIDRISLKKSKVVENGGPKLPTSEQLVEGELAVNYAKGYETLSIKNDSGDVVTFSSDGIINAIIAASAQTKVNTSTYTAYTAATAVVIQGKASTATTIDTASGLTGGGDLSANRTIGLEATGTSGTYNTVKVDEFGRVVSGSYDTTQVTIDDVEGLQDALDSKANSAITISVGEGLSGGGDLSSNRTIGHNTVFAETGKTTPSGDQSPAFGGTFNVPEVSYDKMGHITAVTSHTVTVPSSASTWDENFYITGADTTTATTGLSVALTGNNASAGASFIISAATTDRAGLMSSNDKRLVNKFNVSGFTTVEYNSETKKILFGNVSGGTVGEVDATDFIKDGMVSSAYVETDNLIITFNTDAGKENIVIPLTSIFNPSDYYTTGQVDTAIEAATSGKTNQSDFTAHTTNANIHLTTGNVQSQINGSIASLTAHTADTSIHLTSANVETLIENGITGKADTTAVTAAIDAATSGKMDTSGMTAYTDTTNMNLAIEAATSGKVEVSSFSAHTADTTIHFTTGDVQNQINNSITGKQDTSAMTAYTDTVGMNAAIDAATSGKADTTALTSHVSDTTIHFTTGDVQTQIENSITGKADTTAVTAAIDAATSGKADTTALTSHASDATIHFTTGDVQTQINNSITGKCDTTAFTSHTSNTAIHLTTGDVATQISAAITGKADTTAVTAAIDAATSGKADSTAVTAEISAAVAPYVDGADYDSSTKTIKFMHGQTVVDSIDATAFIKDGMVETVSVSGSDLVITFNTDAGKEPISLPLTDIFNPDNYVGTGLTITTASGLTGGGNLSTDRTIGLEATGTSGTYISVKTDAYGRVTSGNSTVAGSIGQGYAVSNDTGSGATKTAALTGYELVAGGFVTVKFATAVASGATLNINSQGAKNIKFMGSNIPSGLIGDGEAATFVYDGTSYHLISTDAIIKAVWDNERIYSAALNDLNARLVALLDRVDALENAI